MRKAVRAILVRDDNLLVIKRNKFGQPYYTLPGGGIEDGETPEQAVVRELMEETSLHVYINRLVATDNPGEQFGEQLVYLVSNNGGTPVVHQDAEEAADNAKGHNTYEPVWLPVAELPHVDLRSDKLKHFLVQKLASGFADAPEVL